MKELTIEDKAKRYEEALAWIRKMYPTMGFAAKEDAERHFPELKLYEDEWISKEIIDFINKSYRQKYVSSLQYDSWITWLEKQGDNKPVISDDALREGIAHFGITQYQIDNWLKKYVDVEKQGEQKSDWSVGDEQMYSCICDIITKAAFADYDVDENGSLCGKYADIGNWFASLKDRVQCKPKREWSEEDEAALGDILWAINQARTIAKDENDMGNLWCAEHFAKSIKDRYTWKPSKEQMYILNWVANIFLNQDSPVEQIVSNKLQTLYNDLKKLM